MKELYNRDRVMPGFGANTKIVQDGQFIQSAIDSCAVAEGSLREGFANPCIVRVPPGHEKEYYSLVRNAGDVASDKRNVKVIFEDNPGGKFRITQWDNCDSLDGWVACYGEIGLDEDHRFEGEHCFHLYNHSGSGHAGIKKEFDATDFSAYQGILVDFECNAINLKGLDFLFTDTDDVQGRCGVGLSSIILEEQNRWSSVFLPLHGYYDSKAPDKSKIKRFQFNVTRRSGTTGDIDIYLDNIRLVRTVPYRAAILRFDDSHNVFFSIVAKELVERGCLGIFAVDQAHSIVNITNLTKLTIHELKNMRNQGHDIVNHSMRGLKLHEYPDKDTAHSEVVSQQKFLEHYGLVNDISMYSSPGNTANYHTQSLLDKMGLWNLALARGSFPSVTHVYAIGDHTYPNPEVLDTFMLRNTGGVVQLVFHDIENAANFSSRLDWIEENFSEIVLASDVIRRMPNEYQKTPNTDVRSGYITTLTDDFKTYFWYDNLQLDPGGASRNVIPIYDFPTFFKLELSNTADAAEILTFDPTFTSVGNHDGDADAAALTDSGESWVVGQLVGRTVNNTPDGSSGVIVANTATTVTAILSGGTSNDWQPGEAYTITPVGLNQAVGQDQRATFAYDGEGWDITNFYDKTP